MANTSAGTQSTAQDKQNPKPDPFIDRSSDSAAVPKSPTDGNAVVTEEAPSDVPFDTADQLDAVAEQYGCTGVQLAVIKDGVVKYHYEFGFANKADQVAVAPETKYRCASLSKQVVAMVAMAVMDATDFDIDHDISDYLGYSVRNPDYSDCPITPRMLMTHTSSLVDSSEFLSSRNDFSSVPLRRLLEKGSSYSWAKPGSNYLYSNFGLSVLAAALEVYTGRNFDALAKEYLFEKLALDCGFLAKDISDPALIGTLYFPGGSVGYGVSRQMEEHDCDELGQTHHLYQGNLTISAVDYAKLLCVLLNGGGSGGKTVLSASAVKEILKPQGTADDHECGLCVEILKTVLPERTMYCHTGSNFGMYSSFAFDKDAKNGVVVFTSGANAEIDNTGLYNVCAKMIRICYQDI